MAVYAIPDWSILGIYTRKKLLPEQLQDQDNYPLPGVNIVIKNTTTGIQTDFDGNYFHSGK